MASDRSPFIRTAKQIAHELGCSPATVYRAVRAGKLPAVKGGQQGRTSRLQIERKALDDLMTGRKG
ncbi:MAG: Helix-turn-helix domain [Xanthobacteraceae bacterium]|jgi:excisionase family DNA binding protein|nr:Helix-turn-helix domain [Xanthobacteraceae bacterium]